MQRCASIARSDKARPIAYETNCISNIFRCKGLFDAKAYLNVRLRRSERSPTGLLDLNVGVAALQDTWVSRLMNYRHDIV